MEELKNTPAKRNLSTRKAGKIVYWIATIWLASAMIASGVQQLFNIGGFVDIMAHLGYPVYFSLILGTWKISGVVVLLIPKFPLLKEWAYAGFFFAMSGAIFSYIASGDHLNELFPALFLLILTVVSWYFRPAGRKIVSVNQ